jgi:glutamyl-tRNA synthetase
MTIVTRFAPAPSGRLHVGNLRTALHNWLWAQKHVGRFLLRFDDTDRERSSEDYVEAIRADLAWLGMRPDAEFRQSERFARYDAALARLVEAGRGRSSTSSARCCSGAASRRSTIARRST